MKKEYEALEIEIKHFATVDVMDIGPSDLEDGGFVEDDFNL